MLFRINLNNRTWMATSISAVALTVGLAACGGGSNTPTTTTTNSPAASPATAPQTTAPGKLELAGNVLLNGSGASFPDPLYQRWFADFNKKYPKVQINYQARGSGAGVEDFTKGTVDFAASDVAMSDEEIAKVQKGVLLLPMTAGSIVMAYNIPNFTGELKLPRQVYTDIFLGKIKSWNDPKITAANPGATLPNLPIAVVYRSDGSGTTGVFTKHLSAISPEWKTAVGQGKSVKWPTGIGAPKNDGVTAQVLQTQGSIGYVEYGYAKNNNVKFAALENKAGKFITPTDETASKTLEAVTLPENLRAFIEDPEGPDSYPIVTYTWLLAYKQYADASKAKAMEAMIEYGLTEGQSNSAELGYVPLPKKVVEKVGATADAISPDYKIEVGGATASK